MTLNNTYQTIASKVIFNAGYGNTTEYLDARLVSQNIASNKSSVQYRQRVAGGSWWSNGCNSTLDGDYISIGRVDNSYAREITREISHNPDGTKTSVSVSTTFNSAWGGGTVSGSYDLPTIPRASNISCPDFNIGSATTININRAVSSYVDTVSFEYGTYKGTIITKTNQNSIGWVADANELYKNTPLSSGKGKIICTTYNGNELIGTNEYQFTAFVVNSNPIVSVDIIDTNSKSVAITGNNKKLIKFISDARVSINATPQNNATIKSYSAICGDGKSAAVQISTLKAIESNKFTISAKDSRDFVGYTTPNPHIAPMLDYSIVAVKNFEVSRLAPLTENKVKLTYSGTWKKFKKQIDNTTSDNVVTLKYRFKENGGTFGTYINITTSVINDSSFDGELIINNLDYQKQYSIEIVASDLLSTDNYIKDVNKGIGLEEYWDDGVNFPQKLYLKNKEFSFESFQNILNIEKGYFKDKSTGFIIQWGKENGSKRVNFPISFPNKCLMVFTGSNITNGTSPTYMTICGAQQEQNGEWNKDSFRFASMGHISVGDQWVTLTNMQTNNIAQPFSNFPGYGNWIAIGY